MDRLPGFRDFYPEPVPQKDAWSAHARNHIFRAWRDLAHRYSFQEYDGPPLEPLELYTLKSGAEIVAQLYNFVDKGEREVALRPEMTPTLARMAAAHARNYRKPMRWFAIPQLFRYERQQKGRLREHYQFNADILGEVDVAADAELIAMLIDTLRRLGLGREDFVVRLSSRKVWHDFFTQRCSDPAKAYEFYQVIDKLEREAPESSHTKLASLGFALSEVQDFVQASVPSEELRSLVNNLDARGLADFVQIDYRVIRGLAYYTGPVFEAFDRKGEFRAIAGGGRYDDLVAKVTGGKVQMPALGFGMGDVVLCELLRSRNLLPAFQGNVDVCCLIETETSRAAALGVIQELRNAGLSVDYSLTPQNPDKQFKRAVEVGARWIARWIEGSGQEARVSLRDLKSRQEQNLRLAEAIGLMRNAISAP